MELKVLVNGTDLSDAVDHPQTRISKEISGRVSTVDLAFYVEAGAGIYDESQYDAAIYGVDVRELSEIEFRDASTDALLFGGWVTKVSYERIDDRSMWLRCSCHDWTLLLEQAQIISEVFENTSDRAIIQTLVAAYAPRLTALTADISELVLSLGYWEVKDKSLRQALQDISDFSGAEFFVDPAAALKYFAVTESPAAAFALDTGSSDLLFEINDFTRDAERIVNRCTVLGGYLDGGVEINVTYDDPVSIAQYGVRTSTVVDRDITLTIDALLRAQAIVESNAYPLETGKATLWTDGLDVAQLLTITHDQFGIDGDYIIRSLEMQWLDQERVEYSLTFGDPPPTLDRVLRMIAARTAHSTQTLTSIPAAGSVTDDSIGLSGISTDHLYGTINAAGDVIVNAGAIVGTFTGEDIVVDAAIVQGTFDGTNVTVNANTLQGVITGPDIAVDVDTFQGLIISDQLANGIIDSLDKYAASLKPIPTVTANPALPDPDYPVNSFIFNRTNATFYQNIAGTWTASTEGAAVAGRMEFYHVGSIKAGSITGLIAAVQIEEILASQISGLIQASQIDEVNASSIVGTIDATTIGEINATTVTLIGQWGDSDIAALNASKLLAGTVTALVEMTSPLITGGLIELADSLGEISISANGSGTYMTMTGLGINAGYLSTINSAGVVFAGPGSVNMALTTTGLTLQAGGNNIILSPGALTVFPGAHVGYLGIVVNGFARRLAIYN